MQLFTGKSFRLSFALHNLYTTRDNLHLIFNDNKKVSINMQGLLMKKVIGHQKWPCSKDSQMGKVRLGNVKVYLVQADEATCITTISGTKVSTIVTLVPAEQGRYRLKLRHLNFNPYPSRTRTGPWVTLVATDAKMRMS